MTRYEWLLLFHIAAATVWLGGGLTIQILAIRSTRSGDPARMVAIARDAEWVGMRIFAPSSFLLVILGVLLVIDGPWSFDQLWINLALAGWGLSFLTGIFYLGPESGRIGKVLAAQGPTSAEAKSRIDRIFLVSRVELVILYLIVLDMVAKPGI